MKPTGVLWWLWVCVLDCGNLNICVWQDAVNSNYFGKYINLKVKWFGYNYLAVSIEQKDVGFVPTNWH